LEYNTWEDLRQNRLISELSAVIYRLLFQDSQRPSHETIEFVWRTIIFIAMGIQLLTEQRNFYSFVTLKIKSQFLDLLNYSKDKI
jgi:hypothetical protein